MAAPFHGHMGEAQSEKVTDMRIAFIVDVFPSRSETFILNQITGLIERGNDVDIFAAARPCEEVLPQDVRKYGLLSRTHYFNDRPRNIFVRYLYAGYLKVRYGWRGGVPLMRSLDLLKYGKDALSLSLFYRVVSFLREGDFDIIHCQFGTNGNVGVFLKETGIKGKIVTTFHGYDTRLGTAEGTAAYRDLFSRGDLFLSISPYNYEKLIDFGVDPKKVVSHPVGISLIQFAFRGTRASRGPKDPVKVITVARLVKEKGLYQGLQAIAGLCAATSRTIEYRIVGDGPLRSELGDRVKELGIEKVVLFLGARSHEEVVKELQDADIFFLPSTAEALPVSLMEAAATGLPVVATFVGSVPEVVNNEKSGFVVPPGDIPAMTEKLIWLIEHPEKWGEFGREGRKIIEEKFDIDKLNDRLVEIYKKLIAPSRKM